VDECKPLIRGGAAGDAETRREKGGDEGDDAAEGKGLLSSTFQLNLSALYEIGGARRGCVARVKGVWCNGVFRVFYCADMAQVELRGGRV